MHPHQVKEEQAISIISKVYLFNTHRKQNGEPVQTKPARPQPDPAASDKAGRCPDSGTGRFTPAEKTTARIFELNRYIDNNQGSDELVETVKDALSDIETLLQEMRTRCEQTSGDKKTPYERNLAQEAVESYIAQVDRIVEEAELKAARLLQNPRPL